MENENSVQPLDTLMTKLNLTNADLVNASTEQLSFKMLQKGRKGRRLSPNIQEKILTALLNVRPDLTRVRRRHLFHYELDAPVVEKINKALSSSQSGKVKYPRFVDMLLEAGITHYAVDVAANRITFFGLNGEAHIEQGPVLIQTPMGRFAEGAIRSAISDAQKEVIDHPTFLKRIYDAGIASYEVNIRKRRIVYDGGTQFYKENIPLASPEKKTAAPKAAERSEKQLAKSEKAKKKLAKAKKIIRVRKTGRIIKKHRVKKRTRRPYSG